MPRSKGHTPVVKIPTMTLVIVMLQAHALETLEKIKKKVIALPLL